MSHLTVFQFVIRVFTALCDTDTEALRSIMAPGLKSPADRPRGGSTSTVSTITIEHNGIKEGFLKMAKSKWRGTFILATLWSIYVGTVYMSWVYLRTERAVCFETQYQTTPYFSKGKSRAAEYTNFIYVRNFYCNKKSVGNYFFKYATALQAL